MLRKITVFLNFLRKTNRKASFSLEKENSSSLESLSEKILNGQTINSTIDPLKNLLGNPLINPSGIPFKNPPILEISLKNPIRNPPILNSSGISLRNSPIINSSGIPSNSSVNASFNQPKWMRFFQSNEPMKIDIERSIKNENREMIINYVRINYLSFDFTQLVLSLEKRLKIELNLKLFHEIKLRIAVEAYQINPQILLSLLNYSVEACKNDPLISRFLAVGFIRNFSEFSFIQQIHVMNFLLKINILPEKTLGNFLKNWTEWRIEGKLKDFSLKDLNELLAVVNELYQLLKSEKFEVFFNGNFKEEICKEVLIFWFFNDKFTVKRFWKS